MSNTEAPEFWTDAIFEQHHRKVLFRWMRNRQVAAIAREIAADPRAAEWSRRPDFHDAIRAGLKAADQWRATPGWMQPSQYKSASIAFKGVLGIFDSE